MFEPQTAEMGDGICALLADSLEYSKERESTEELPVAKL